jgi:chromosomal replication initiation ATPase DnaA
VIFLLVYIDMQNILDKQLFGQHLAADIVLNALRSHLNDEDPSKALVLSFHGWAGSGKTHLAELIMKSLYKEGTESKFVKFYMASYHFPDPTESKVMEYQVRAYNHWHVVYILLIVTKLIGNSEGRYY